MAVYFITGALGSGKSLIAISKIQEKLVKGLPVATNLNLNLHYMPSVGRNAKKTRVYRLPDKPLLEDFKLIGLGNKEKDESKNGLIVLDECGTWLNTRTWNDKSRQPVLDWFLHARKLGWDILFLVQSISLVDKQARDALAEHIVYCRRFDRLPIPFIGFFINLILGIKISPPKIHLGIVKYGDSLNAPIVDRWIYRGTDLYSAYDTNQIFSSDYDNGTFSLLPPYFTHGIKNKNRSLKEIMRLTKIYLKRFSKFRLVMLGVLLGLGISYLYLHYKPDFIPSENTQSNLSNLKIKYSKLIGNDYSIKFEDKNGYEVDSKELILKGFKLEIINSCRIRVYKGSENAIIIC